MAAPPALPAPGENATAALAIAGTTQPEEMVIHSGAATTEGDMSYLEEDFDPCRNDPRRSMPGVLDSNIDISQLNTLNFNSGDQRTAMYRPSGSGTTRCRPGPGKSTDGCAAASFAD